MIDSNSDLGPLPQADSNSLLQTESFTALRGALPSDRFVLRSEPSPDAGVDICVELLIDGCYSNIRFFIQVKATEDAKYNTDGSISFSADVSNINYLLNGLRPLYVLYIANSRKLRYVWINDEVKRIEKDTPGWIRQKTVTLRFQCTLDQTGCQNIYDRIKAEAKSDKPRVTPDSAKPPAGGEKGEKKALGLVQTKPTNDCITAIRAKVDNDPKPPDWRANPTTDEVKYQRDLDTLRHLLRYFPLGEIDRYIAGLPCSLLQTNTHYFDGFTSVWTASATHIYNPTLKKILTELFEAWKNTRKHHDLFHWLSPSLAVWDGAKHGAEGERAYKTTYDDSLRFREHIVEFAKQIKNEYLEIDLDETSRTALEDFWAFESTPLPGEEGLGSDRNPPPVHELT